MKDDLLFRNFEMPGERLEMTDPPPLPRRSEFKFEMTDEQWDAVSWLMEERYVSGVGKLKNHAKVYLLINKRGLEGEFLSIKKTISTKLTGFFGEHWGSHMGYDRWLKSEKGTRDTREATDIIWISYTKKEETWREKFDFVVTDQEWAAIEMLIKDSLLVGIGVGNRGYGEGKISLLIDQDEINKNPKNWYARIEKEKIFNEGKNGWAEHFAWDWHTDTGIMRNETDKIFWIKPEKEVPAVDKDPNW